MLRPSTYRHVCALARTLDVVGDRWSLLVIRDLVGGPRRFTDLIERLGGITPKLLTTRLRQLEASGLVAVDREEGRRQVWYRLTERGNDLVPALEALTAWGIRHARRPPLPGERIHPEHLMKGVVVALNDGGFSPPSPVTWTVRFADSEYSMRFTGEGWELVSAVPEADVTITTTLSAWAEMLMSTARDAARPVEMQVEGDVRKVEQFLSTFQVRQAAPNA